MLARYYFIASGCSPELGAWCPQRQHNQGFCERGLFGYGWGGRSQINGEDTVDERGDVSIAPSAHTCVPYVCSETDLVRGEINKDAGADTATFSLT